MHTRFAAGQHLSVFTAYAAALSCGLAYAFWTAPGPLETANQLSVILNGDPAEYLTAQRYFLGDSWHWPLLHTTLLNRPEGVNVAFADAIPIILLPSKLLRHWLPSQPNLLPTWMFLVRTLQPVAAVFALHATGERRFLPLLSIAIIELAMPGWTSRQCRCE